MFLGRIFSCGVRHVGRRGFSASSFVSSAVSDEQSVFIGIGSNLGDRAEHIVGAIAALNAFPNIRFVQSAFMYETAPMHLSDQPAYLNTAVQLAVSGSTSPLALLRQLKAVETERGRVANVRYGARCIDLDILLFDRHVVDSAELTVPHMMMAHRPFVLAPLNDIAADVLHPIYKQTVAQLYAHVNAATTAASDGAVLCRVTPLRRGRLFRWKVRTYLMAIVNVTPDSFSDGNRFHTVDAAVSHSLSLLSSGADCIDIGGESTRPGAAPLSATEEAERVIPVITAVRRADDAAVISIDTYHSETATAAIRAGADIINDISGGLFDDKMTAAVAALNVPYIISHTRGSVYSQHAAAHHRYADVVSDVRLELESRVDSALLSGLYRWNVVCDCGIGFAKSTEQNISLIRSLQRVRPFDTFPLLIGPSRKRFISRLTGSEELPQRVFGTAATVTASISQGADMIRVHDVAEMSAVIKISDAVFRSPPIR